jgi:uncharacterized protein
LLLTEVLFLFSFWVLWFAGKLVARNTPNDALYKFARVFWRTLRSRPAPLREVVADEESEAGMPEGTDEELLKGMAEESEEGDAESEETTVGKGVPAGGIRSATLTIKVVPGASRNQVCGYLDKALKIQVTAPAEGGQANKAVIDLLATTLGLKSHQIQLLRGHYQALKVVQIAGMQQEEVTAKLGSFQ